MSRRKSREIAMKLLFEISMNVKETKEAIEQYKESNKNLEDVDFTYIENTLEGIFKNIDFLNRSIEENSNNWKINRISKINTAILKIAIYEIYFEEDIPEKVSANEAVNLAKKYSDEKSPAFINGVIGNIIKSKQSTKNMD
ncbi:N utilization substance protein B [Clostridium pasteurianum DSM 525 = ATCC 6013]|uniref:Transcription antitermination protein NusB n=1 Tax=Clostridium pasteurianum DSM 525 = ATCC 6013 TaxID=1262449 RepID=A0A0H3J234_CLOPA|nr:transcription antitermination factor NusB [Clostridium pasteurianum]AJA47976.1 N utilization substance protein B [Clostridium pasteurianum DSM 525 = ATCC 6013]AJA51964.1 N utilization substance protein B [Clostridium pasteurianum DSM 525 = ATCC 6013]AOZ75261.1 N utilization substance protein B [Clostridium pasteurianum DSM 525 = ATCC 6013]AOZ79056.1 N utilization substance protein B [Clostridium pasteurianum]ELP59879.1 transcription antitermination protein NusB [Clostridium pasteurianum DSM